MSQTSETRSLHFSDDKSDKFWTITLEDTQHTVHYGRTGTQGQQQTKAFPTAEKARQSYEKLIREKLSKGYVESGEQRLASIPTAQKTKATPVVEVKEAFASQSPQGEIASVPTPTPEAPPPAKTSVTATLTVEQTAAAELPYPPPRSLNLDPIDWFWAPWRKLAPLERSPVRPFDPADGMARLRKAQDGQKFVYQWIWRKAEIQPFLSQEEAHFWFAVVTAPMRHSPESGRGYVKSEELIEQMSRWTFDGAIAPEDIQQSLEGFFEWNRSVEELFPIMNLLPIEDFMALVDQGERAGSVFLAFRFYQLPYLSELEREKLRSHLRSRFAATRPETYSPNDCKFAAYLGMQAEILPVIESWTADMLSSKQFPFDRDCVQAMIFGLADPQLVQHHFRRLNLILHPHRWQDFSPPVRAWLAHTEYAGLDGVRDAMLAAGHRQIVGDFLNGLSLVVAPEVAPLMLEITLSSQVPLAAWQWLEDHPAQTIAGLIPTAAGRGKLATAAVEFLRAMKRRGYTAYLETCLAHEPVEIAEQVRAVVLDVEEFIPFDDQTTPDWLQQGPTTLKRKSSKTAVWTVPLTLLPPLTVGQFHLNDTQVNAVLNALRQSKLDNPHPLIQAIQTHVDRPSGEAFAWRLFEVWLLEGAASQENWAMIAVGFLGGDTSALKLAPLIRVWPGESQHPRAVLGLECLRAIGTDTALMQINGIAQKVKFKGIKQRAQECMEAIAQDRNMAREQLEDRIVPDCELDERGSCILDFGARQFQVVLGADLKPMVKDGGGKLKPNLPSPGTKDDPEKAEAATNTWKLLKKQVTEVIKIQTVRLEQAMVMRRRWTVEEFTLLLVRHPLMTHLVQRLIWGGYDAAGRLTASFRVTEDQTCADEMDETFELNGLAQVGIVHPLHLTPETRSTWSERLIDYEIVQPFQQLGRSLHGLEPDEKTTLELTRFQNLEIPIVALVRTLENLGWQRGCLHDHGDYSLHFKYFSSADVTAVVGEYEEVFVELSVVVGSGFEDINRCCFLKGLHNDLEYFPGQSWMPEVNAQRIPLGEVDPVIISEVLNDLIIVTAKAP